MNCRCERRTVVTGSKNSLRLVKIQLHSVSAVAPPLVHWWYGRIDTNTLRTLIGADGARIPRHLRQAAFVERTPRSRAPTQ